MLDAQPRSDSLEYKYPERLSVRSLLFLFGTDQVSVSHYLNLIDILWNSSVNIGVYVE